MKQKTKIEDGKRKIGWDNLDDPLRGEI